MQQKMSSQQFCFKLCKKHTFILKMWNIKNKIALKCGIFFFLSLYNLASLELRENLLTYLPE